MSTPKIPSTKKPQPGPFMKRAMDKMMARKPTGKGVKSV